MSQSITILGGHVNRPAARRVGEVERPPPCPTARLLLPMRHYSWLRSDAGGSPNGCDRLVRDATGPVSPHQERYEVTASPKHTRGLITHPRCEIKIGMRYFVQPRMCMLQWRHSGLVNFLNRTPNGFQVRLEGLWIG